MVVGVLILLGLVASVFLIFSNSLQLTRVGLVVALWAAVIGGFTATRYRRESELGQAKVRGLRTVYELQLEREVSARREYELEVESRVRAEVGAEASEMAALRAELAVLRESLQRLFDGDLPVDRPALRADAVRLHELPGASANGNSAEADTWDAWSVPAVPRGSVTPVFELDHPEPPVFAGPDDDPVTAETSVVTLDDPDEPEPEPEAPTLSESGRSTTRAQEFDASRPDSWFGPPARESEPAPAPARSAEVDSGREHAGKTITPEYDGPDVRPPWAPPTPTPIVVGTAGTRRRRRADPGDGTCTGQLSVAEILANLASEQNRSN
ncbi:hypothetical protein BJY24_002213 [Nocardia transvalensis]|uniref:DUF6779 domain-containing protein n=1 Tax=Nocardia transvalensis TaxID=37333 RepID=A0A7W9PBZ4_9NOCA|nr:DUF6779 domain-containing protein [Nocardia transvalensis]MBB5913346.1 hypothetical protein [Nocardia transvalensis]